MAAAAIPVAVSTGSIAPCRRLLDPWPEGGIVSLPKLMLVDNRLSVIERFASCVLVTVTVSSSGVPAEKPPK